MANSNRKNFLFFTKEGFTSDSKNKDIQNMQILGDGFGNDILEAFNNFKYEHQYLKNFSSMLPLFFAYTKHDFAHPT